MSAEKKEQLTEQNELSKCHQELFDGLTIGNPCETVDDCMTYDLDMAQNRKYTEKELSTPVVSGKVVVGIQLIPVSTVPFVNIVWETSMGKEGKTMSLRQFLQALLLETRKPFKKEIVDALVENYGHAGNKDFYTEKLTLSGYMEDDTFITGPLTKGGQYAEDVLYLQLSV